MQKLSNACFDVGIRQFTSTTPSKLVVITLDFDGKLKCNERADRYLLSKTLNALAPVPTSYQRRYNSDHSLGLVRNF